MTRILALCSAVDPTGSVKQFDLALPRLRECFDVARQVVSSPRAVELTTRPQLIHTLGATAFRAMQATVHKEWRPGVSLPSWLASGAASVEPTLGLAPRLTATFAQSEHERDWSARLMPAPMQFSAKPAVQTPALTGWARGGDLSGRGVSDTPIHSRPEGAVPLAQPVRAGNDSHTILATGAFDNVANLKHIVWAFDVLKYAHPQLHLVLLGDGPQRADMERFAYSLGHDDLRVRCVGRQEDVTPFLRNATQVWGSHTHGGIKFLLEAMASGVPVIATHTPDSERVIRDGKNGRLVSTDRPVEMARVAHALLTSPDRAHALVVAGQAVAAGYPVADLADALGGVYHTLTSLAPVRLE